MIYPENFESKIGFDRIRSLLSEKCLSPMGLEKVENIRFIDDYDKLSHELTATYEFQQILQFEDFFPAEHYYRISDSLGKIRVEGTFPEVQEVFDLKRSLETVKTILNFFRNKDSVKYPVLRSICSSVKTYPYVLEAIDRIIDKRGVIRDNASSRLKEIRAELIGKSIQVSKRLNAILKQAQAEGFVDTDTSVSVRNGRGVIPVSAYDKRKIKGLIHDQSASGKTVFIEPEEIVEMNNDIVELEYEEKREIVRILTAFADNIRPYIDDLLESNLFLGEIDFLRAKAILGNRLQSIKPGVNDKPLVLWKRAVHPLLFLAFEKTPGRKVVPLDMVLDEKERILLISGPNAGGKSVCLKTVGLLQYMLQCGLTIPVAEGSETGIFRSILIDIGDEQSIDNDLSTYSSHLINMKFFIKNGNEKTLVLIDEFGTGTEPMLGGSIAEAILGELNRKQVYGVITTHYTNLKHFASLTDGIVNGAMAFDNHLMQPLFQLNIGKPGSSFAFEIARKIGLPEEILSAASEKAGVKNINYDRHLKDIARDKRYWEMKRQSIRQNEKRLDELMAEYESELAGAKSLRKDIVAKAKDEARKLLDESNRMIENTIRQIKESQAEKEKTKEIRHQLEEFKTSVDEKIKPVLTHTEQKIALLNSKAKKIKRDKEPEQKTAPSAIEPNLPFKPGDAVRMIDTMAAGEIISIKGKKAEVETGSIRFQVPLDKIERISRSELKKSIRATQTYRENDPGLVQRNINFKPEIDLRGVRGEEAINQVRDLIDDALIVQHRNLRILHGKGNGILRQLVREYLATCGVVKTFRDEHVEFGGSGITVVEMDL
ncbi:MAG: endonuclease MutS2 [Bacteroidetes bacterium GWE2_41_25]|nr:MAG: endonuclease MutS2 [Bacteroidetes bacterium GWA2_40_15]OFX88507.1 MAG: endonuclease MutS2 [Bacteroidetes bacterium GWC2_40_22]OFY08312.1 MAG: endonuclease MutS2 [Bacteroidetes bacterium GWE2_41_25]HBH82613.1 endonuclease MutS2 [Bacteroidales bacterium]HBQ84694.1 endonuclease MutS2 [Bacteroidales bacterium]